MKKNKDYVWAVLLVFLHFLLWYYFAYVRYSDVPVSEYNYILGLPEWFFYSSVVVSIFIIIILVVICNYIFNDDIKEEERYDTSR